ncbi:hypothetical protein [Yersinia enterocolitica]|uniref:hypothetical protein n=1 Tax=Yersinia enterocolitica TaxID=630 RepID=UPI003CFC3D66
MKLNQSLSLAFVLTSSALMAGCASNVGKTPDTAQKSNSHGFYWTANPADSVAKNAYSLAGVDVSFADSEVKPGSSDEAGISKYLMNGSMGAVTGGLSGLSIMTLGSLYSKEDAEFISTEQFVAFVPNPNNLPYDDPSLVKEGARYTFNFVKDSSAKRGFNADKQVKAVDECVIEMSMMAKFNECVLSSKPTKDIAFDKRLFEFQAIRPAVGTELSQLKLPKGNYSVIRYGLIQTTWDKSSKGYNGFIMRADSTYTAPRMLAVSIDGADYYLLKGELGKKGYPEKTLIKKFW